MLRRLVSFILLISVATAVTPASQLPVNRVQAVFNAACELARDGLGTPIDDDTKLYFWARYKIATGEKVKDSGLFADRKRQYFASLGKMSKEQAMREYINRMDQVRADWRKH